MIDLEKYYKTKYNDSIQYIKPQKKSVSEIKDSELFFETEEVEKDNYNLIKPKRELSIFSNKCKYCKKSTIKQLDRECYLRYDCCFECSIRFEEK